MNWSTLNSKLQVQRQASAAKISAEKRAADLVEHRRVELAAKHKLQDDEKLSRIMEVLTSPDDPRAVVLKKKEETRQLQISKAIEKAQVRSDLF